MVVSFKNQSETNFKIETDKTFEKRVKIRSGFHQNPKLAGKEKQTQKL